MIEKATTPENQNAVDEAVIAAAALASRYETTAARERDMAATVAADRRAGRLQDSVYYN